MVICPDDINSTPSLYHVKEGAGSPKAEQSTAIELPTFSDIFLGITVVKVTRPKNIKYMQVK